MQRLNYVNLCLSRLRVRRLDDIFPLFSANNLYHDDSGWIGIAAYYSLYLVVFFLTMGWVFLNVLCTFNLLVNVTRRKYRFPEKVIDPTQ